MGVINVSKLLWDFQWVNHEIDLIENGEKLNWDTLPDLSGIILTNKLENSSCKAKVINADGSARLFLENPWKRSNFFSPLDSYGFSYPTKELGKPAVVVWVWSPSPTGGVATEHLYTFDADSGKFLDHHPIK